MRIKYVIHSSGRVTYEKDGTGQWPCDQEVKFLRRLPSKGVCSIPLSESEEEMDSGNACVNLERATNYRINRLMLVVSTSLHVMLLVKPEHFPETEAYCLPHNMLWFCADPKLPCVEQEHTLLRVLFTWMLMRSSLLQIAPTLSTHKVTPAYLMNQELLEFDGDIDSLLGVIQTSAEMVRLTEKKIVLLKQMPLAILHKKSKTKEISVNALVH